MTACTLLKKMKTSETEYSTMDNKLKKETSNFCPSAGQTPGQAELFSGNCDNFTAKSP